MSMRILSLILAAMATMFLCVPSAFAIWFRSSSIEWKTDISDVIVVGVVQSTTLVDSYNEYWNSQEVSCKSAESIKGKWDKAISFRQMYSKSEEKVKIAASQVKQGERLLLFLQANAKSKTFEVENWINLTNPIKSRGVSPHAVYDNEFRLLSRESDILNLVQKRVAEKHAAKRGLIVVPNVESGVHHDFVMTADPKFRQRFVDQLKSENVHERCSAIYNLVSYPSDDTRQLIQPYLYDSVTSHIQNYDGKGQDITYYPVRQAAFVALTLLDDNPPTPSPYYESVRSFVFSTGFENKTYFPVGKWKRLNYDNDNPFRTEKSED